MKLAIIAVALVVAVGFSGLPGVTKTGPDRPAPTIFEQGGGGGPAMENRCIDQFC